MTVSPFTRAALLMFSGPLIWGAHFLALYVFTALVCARDAGHLRWFGAGIVQWAIGLLTLLGVAVVGMVILRSMHGGKEDSFVRWIALTAGGLSVLAMLWEALPAIVIPACG